MSLFFSASYSSTASCLARAVVNNVLKGDFLTAAEIKEDIEVPEMCKIA